MGTTDDTFRHTVGDIDAGAVFVGNNGGDHATHQILRFDGGLNFVNWEKLVAYINTVATKDIHTVVLDSSAITSIDSSALRGSVAAGEGAEDLRGSRDPSYALVQRRPPAGREVPPDHPVAVQMQDPAFRESSEQRLAHLRGIEARQFREAQRLCDGIRQHRVDVAQAQPLARKPRRQRHRLGHVLVLHAPDLPAA